MLWSSCAFGTRTVLLWFGHGCSGHRMFLEHERVRYLAKRGTVIHALAMTTTQVPTLCDDDCWQVPTILSP